MEKNRGYISWSLSKLNEIRPRALPFIPFQQHVPHSNIGFAIRQASAPLFFVYPNMFSTAFPAFNWNDHLVLYDKRTMKEDVG
ncbi:hypothetical protein FCV25MIE_19818 [Fagus crenata]